MHSLASLNRHKQEYTGEGIEILKVMHNKPITESSCHGRANIHYFAF